MFDIRNENCLKFAAGFLLTYGLDDRTATVLLCQLQDEIEVEEEAVVYRRLHQMATGTLNGTDGNAT